MQPNSETPQKNSQLKITFQKGWIFTSVSIIFLILFIMQLFSELESHTSIYEVIHQPTPNSVRTATIAVPIVIYGLVRTFQLIRIDKQNYLSKYILCLLTLTLICSVYYIGYFYLNNMDKL
jgi:hypothetical protein